MADTTAENISLVAPELADFISRNDCLVDLILADVAGQVEYEIYGSKEEMAQRYLAAHYITLAKQGEDGLSSGASGPVRSEKVGDVQVEYNASSSISGLTRLDTTKYGALFTQIRRMVNVGFNVYTP